MSRSPVGGPAPRQPTIGPDLTNECKLIMQSIIDRGLTREDATAVLIASLCAVGAAAGYSRIEITASLAHEWVRYMDAASELQPPTDGRTSRPHKHECMDEVERLKRMLADSARMVARLLALLTDEQRGSFWSEENARNLRTDTSSEGGQR